MVHHVVSAGRDMSLDHRHVSEPAYRDGPVHSGGVSRPLTGVIIVSSGLQLVAAQI